MPAGPIGSCWVAGTWTDTCWAIDTWADAVAIAFILDLNTRLLVYLRVTTGAPTGDFNVLMQGYFAARTGDMNARMRQLIEAATP